MQFFLARKQSKFFCKVFFMESFAVTYASCQEVRSGEEAVEALLETHWPHMFAIGGEVVLGVSRDCI